jgi:hypothetical protein
VITDNQLLAMQGDAMFNYRSALLSLAEATKKEFEIVDQLDKGDPVQMGHLSISHLPGSMMAALKAAAELRTLVQLRRATARQFTEDEPQHDGSDY